MLQQGLRFILEVDGIEKSATAVVSFTLCQNLSTPFLLNVDIPPAGLGAATNPENTFPIRI